jgi:hypothetical protein
MKTFNVRVAIVEPRIIDTAMAQRIAGPSNGTLYVQRARMATVFTNALQDPTSPSVVAQEILEIAESGTWHLRHPAGRVRFHFYSGVAK